MRHETAPTEACIWTLAWRDAHEHDENRTGIYRLASRAALLHARQAVSRYKLELLVLAAATSRGISEDHLCTMDTHI